MDDLSKIGGTYVVAKPHVYTVQEKMSLFFKFWWRLMKSFVEYLPFLFDNVKDFVLGIEDKVIEGQVSLGELRIEIEISQ